MSKYTLCLNSHSLSAFQSCEMKHLLSDVVQITKAEEKLAMSKGTEIARILQLMYYRQIRYKARSRDEIKKIWKPILDPQALLRRFGKKFSIDDSMILIKALATYVKTYETESWHPVAVEKGFSRILYEDSSNLFVYEGRPDLVVRDNSSGEIYPIDHKTQGMTYNIYEFNNQCIGYDWACVAKKFVYNYLLLTKEPRVRRTLHSFSQSQIDQWVSDTTEWFFRIKSSYQKKSFIRTRASCQGKYGTCEYAEICEQTTPASRGWIIKRDFKKAERRRSW